jgi:hypothetical protein
VDHVPTLAVSANHWSHGELAVNGCLENGVSLLLQLLLLDANPHVSRGRSLGW